MEYINELFYMNLLERRAAFKVYSTYRIKQPEVVTLMSLAAIMLVKGRKTISVKNYIDWVTGNRRAKNKLKYHVYQLEKYGMIEFVSYKTVNRSVIITLQGVKALDIFENELERIQAVYGPVQGSYKDLGFSDLDKLPKGFGRLPGHRFEIN